MLNSVCHAPQGNKQIVRVASVETQSIVVNRTQDWREAKSHP